MKSHYKTFPEIFQLLKTALENRFSFKIVIKAYNCDTRYKNSTYFRPPENVFDTLFLTWLMYTKLSVLYKSWFFLCFFF